MFILKKGNGNLGRKLDHSSPFFPSPTFPLMYDKKMQSGNMNSGEPEWVGKNRKKVNIVIDFINITFFVMIFDFFMFSLGVRKNNILLTIFNSPLIGLVLDLSPF